MDYQTGTPATPTPAPTFPRQRAGRARLYRSVFPSPSSLAYRSPRHICLARNAANSPIYSAAREVIALHDTTNIPGTWTCSAQHNEKHATGLPAGNPKPSPLPSVSSYRSWENREPSPTPAGCRVNLQVRACAVFCAAIALTMTCSLYPLLLFLTQALPRHLILNSNPSADVTVPLGNRPDAYANALEFVPHLASSVSGVRPRESNMNVPCKKQLHVDDLRWRTVTLRRGSVARVNMHRSGRFVNRWHRSKGSANGRKRENRECEEWERRERDERERKRDERVESRNSSSRPLPRPHKVTVAVVVLAVAVADADVAGAQRSLCFRLVADLMSSLQLAATSAV
ncbi:hypothetical protein GGX14DRAFT_579088 [Mycena pura]|uniref:Uncharacterized protein n=1 Tax=Mycena pura TaxID=153505 RepID=A0AAD6UN47_9AGAR|nr:hypothetical protein GGX14DRAFT_579088 [Mycena pura]